MRVIAPPFPETGWESRRKVRARAFSQCLLFLLLLGGVFRNFCLDSVFLHSFGGIIVWLPFDYARTVPILKGPFRPFEGANVTRSGLWWTVSAPRQIGTNDFLFKATSARIFAFLRTPYVV